MSSNNSCKTIVPFKRVHVFQKQKMLQNLNESNDGNKNGIFQKKEKWLLVSHGYGTKETTLLRNVNIET